MTKDPSIYVGHILMCVNAILEYTKGMDERAFLNNKLVQDAVLRNFEVIGEATKQVDDSFRTKYPHIPWRKMAGLRDKLIHDYMGVDLWAVWQVIIEVLPQQRLDFMLILEQEKE
jgi:uncharacterized protein with HEPN domain